MKITDKRRFIVTAYDLTRKPQPAKLYYTVSTDRFHFISDAAKRGEELKALGYRVNLSEVCDTYRDHHLVGQHERNWNHTLEVK